MRVRRAGTPGTPRVTGTLPGLPQGLRRRPRTAPDPAAHRRLSTSPRPSSRVRGPDPGERTGGPAVGEIAEDSLSEPATVADADGAVDGRIFAGRAAAEPAQPAGSAGPAQPAGAAQPAEPAQPAGSAGPAQPAGAAQPAEPAQPAGSAEPAQPAGSAEPAEPAGAADGRGATGGTLDGRIPVEDAMRGPADGRPPGETAAAETAVAPRPVDGRPEKPRPQEPRPARPRRDDDRCRNGFREDGFREDRPGGTTAGVDLLPRAGGGAPLGHWAAPGPEPRRAHARRGGPRGRRPRRGLPGAPRHLREPGGRRPARPPSPAATGPRATTGPHRLLGVRGPSGPRARALPGPLAGGGPRRPWTRLLCLPALAALAALVLGPCAVSDNDANGRWPQDAAPSPLLAASGHGTGAYRAPRPPIVPREVWAAPDGEANTSALTPPPARYDDRVVAVFVHHTDSPNTYDCSEAPRIIRYLAAGQTGLRDWDDIGYNFLVDRCGTVYEGRAGGVSRPVTGAHTKGFNHRTAGIAALGTFTEGVPVPEAMADAIAALAAWKLGLSGVDPRAHVSLTSSSDLSLYAEGTTARLPAVAGHSDGYATDCPGAALSARLPQIRELAARLQGRLPATPHTRPTAEPAERGQTQARAGALVP